MSARVANLNPAIFRICREQIGAEIEEVVQKIGVGKLAEIEKGEVAPTFAQLEKLAKFYCVPQWVFLRAQLPAEYNFARTAPAFRRFAETEENFADHKIRTIVDNVERLREMILDFRADMDTPIEPFLPPDFAAGADVADLAAAVRRWLGCGARSYGFDEWRGFVEDKGVFVFLTSRYSHWSKSDAENSFRGFAIYKENLPVIVINNSDANKAQSFTLLHELAHLLRRESSADVDFSPGTAKRVEQWCNRLAGEILMPSAAFLAEMGKNQIARNIEADLNEIKRVADVFQVSPFACIVKMRQVGLISQSHYERLDALLKDEYKKFKEQQQEDNKDVPIKRNMAKEKIRQYGRIYSNTVVQAYRDDEIGLHKLCKLFELKRASDAMQLEGLL